MKQPGWLAPQLGHGVRCVVTSREAPVSAGVEFNLATHVGDDPQRVEMNRRHVIEAMGVDSIQWLDQVHGADCVEADGATADTALVADAVWTRSTGLALGILTADCVPLLLAAEDRVGAAHAGWQGLERGVIGSLLENMGDPGSVKAFVGPCISTVNYEVGVEVWSRFGAFPSAVLPHPTDDEKRLLDLRTIACAQLRAGGVVDIDSVPHCTYADVFGPGEDYRWYSHRRAVHLGSFSGRFASLIVRD